MKIVGTLWTTRRSSGMDVSRPQSFMWRLVMDVCAYLLLAVATWWAASLLAPKNAAHWVLLVVGVALLLPAICMGMSFFRLLKEKRLVQLDRLAISLALLAFVFLSLPTRSSATSSSLSSFSAVTVPATVEHVRLEVQDTSMAALSSTQEL